MGLITDAEVECALLRQGTVTPILTSKSIIDKIQQVQYYVFPNTTLTICCLTLDNGYAVTGDSACVDPKEFDKDLGESIAYTNAVNKLWSLESYLKKEALHNDTSN